MDERIEKRLTEANKLIFVKRYDEAQKVLDQILTEEDGHRELLVHLRKIELAVMLKQTNDLREKYLREINLQDSNGKSEPLHAVCLALLEQHGEIVDPKESINSYQAIIKKFGPQAGAYYGIGYAMEQQGNHERAVFNYEQSLAIDSGWYLSYFGLSQVHYQMRDEKNGDQFFYLFEQAAPYNVYGNFETHRKLSHEFLERELFSEAEAAIATLSEWWHENKGLCPVEIQIYEQLATAKISEVMGEAQQSTLRKTRAIGMAERALSDRKTKGGILYFIAKVLEEHDQHELAFRFYKRILAKEGNNPQIVQKIGSQFLSVGEFQQAKELFEDAYQHFPENPDIRFCRLVAGLKLSGVNVEDYLIGRERLRQLIDSGGDKVELLALLHSLLAKYSDDPEVHSHVADIYLKLGNKEKAGRHYKKMHVLDAFNRSSALKYASYLMQNQQHEEAQEILKSISIEEAKPEDRQDIFWSQAVYHAQKNDFKTSNDYLIKVLKIDAWNVSYLVQEIANLTMLSQLPNELKVIDGKLHKLSDSDDVGVDWHEFSQVTDQIEVVHAYGLAYARRKLRFLYANGAEGALRRLIRTASLHDPSQGTYDLMKLLNTNFDSPQIYWALGVLFKDVWQLQTSAMWFEQVLMHPMITDDLVSKTYLELADCYVWQNVNLKKAIELTRIAIDMTGLTSSRKEKNARGNLILAHAYLKSGEMRLAQTFLEQTEGEGDPEVRYLQGLLHYRNGAHKRANEIWKPLLTTRTLNLRFHNIKQDVLRFYFEGEPYLQAN